MRKVFLLFALCLCFPARPSQSADGPEATKAIVDKAIKAHGGEEKLTKSKAATWKAKGRYFSLGQEIPFTGSWALQPPDKARIAVEGELKGRKFRRILVTDGSSGWIKLDDAVEEMNKVTLAEEKERLYASWLASLTPLKGKEFTLSPLEERRVGERLAVGVKVSHPDYRDVSLFFDKQNGLLLLSETRLKDLTSGSAILQEVIYGDYRDMAGVKRAMQVTVRWDRKKQAEATLHDYVAVERLEDNVFAKPE